MLEISPKKYRNIIAISHREKVDIEKYTMKKIEMKFKPIINSQVNNIYELLHELQV